MTRITKYLSVVAGIGAVTVLTASPAQAQGIGFAAGYQYLHFSVEGEGTSMPAGWFGELNGRLSPTMPAFRWVFEVAGSYKSESGADLSGVSSATGSVKVKVHSFVGGFRFISDKNPRAKPYGQVLVGIAQNSQNGSVTITEVGPGFIRTTTFLIDGSESDLAIAFGGGVDIPINDKWSVRTGADYARVFAEDVGVNVFRIHVGIATSFSRK